MIHVLGGKGFVGSALVRYCQVLGLEYAVIDRHNWDQYAGHPCRLFINANGNSRKPLAREKPLDDFAASVATVRRSLEDFPCDRYLLLSSCDVYPDCSSPETTLEDQILDPARQSPYGFHKYLAELCVRHAARQAVIFRLGGFIGPGLRKNAIFDILHGGPLWLDPDSELQFLHTDEAARIMLTLAGGDDFPSGETFNLCGSGLIRLQEVIDCAGRTIPVRPSSPLVRYDVSLAKISRLIEIPGTRTEVLQFVTRALSGPA